MPWSPGANKQMEGIKKMTSASSAEMGNLLNAINKAAAKDGNHKIPFGKMRDHHVTATVRNKEVVKVEYGDK